jgi:hypothetical protein
MPSSGPHRDTITFIRKRQSNPILTGGAVRATGSGQPKPLA